MKFHAQILILFFVAISFNSVFAQDARKADSSTVRKNQEALKAAQVVEESIEVRSNAESRSSGLKGSEKTVIYRDEEKIKVEPK